MTIVKKIIDKLTPEQHEELFLYLSVVNDESPNTKKEIEQYKKVIFETQAELQNVLQINKQLQASILNMEQKNKGLQEEVAILTTELERSRVKLQGLAQEQIDRQQNERPQQF